MSAPIPPFVDQAGGGRRFPAFWEIPGRLTVLVPVGYRTNVPKHQGKDGEVCDEADFDMYLMAGPWPLMYGALKDGTRPPTHRVDGASKFLGCSTQYGNIVKSLRAVWNGQSATGSRLGVITRSEVGGKPWNIEALDPGDQRRNDVARILAAAQTGFYPNDGGPNAGQPFAWVEPVELAPATPQPAQQSYVPQATAVAMPSFLQAAAPVAPAPAKPAQMTDEQWAPLTDDQKRQAVAYFASVSQNTF
jgi:hypothetical protein